MATDSWKYHTYAGLGIAALGGIGFIAQGMMSDSQISNIYGSLNLGRDSLWLVNGGLFYASAALMIGMYKDSRPNSPLSKSPAESPLEKITKE